MASRHSRFAVLPIWRCRSTSVFVLVTTQLEEPLQVVHRVGVGMLRCAMLFTSMRVVEITKEAAFSSVVQLHLGPFLAGGVFMADVGVSMPRAEETAAALAFGCLRF